MYSLCVLDLPLSVEMSTTLPPKVCSELCRSTNLLISGSATDGGLCQLQTSPWLVVWKIDLSSETL